MAQDPNPTLRAELNAQLVVLAPQIRGLHDLANTSISPDLRTAVELEITERERRRDLIEASLAALDAAVNRLDDLEADGYPNLVPGSVPNSLFEELKEENADLTAAIGLFAEQAANLSVSLGAPERKS